MTGSPLLPLRAAIRARLVADAALAAASGGAFRLADEPPRGIRPVYALWGPSRVRDASVSGVAGHRTALAILVWGEPGAAAAALAVADRVAVLLDGAAPAPAGHRLVSLAVDALAAERDPATGAVRAAIDLIAATEVAA